jgi:hypothetical protein
MRRLCHECPHTKELSFTGMKYSHVLYKEKFIDNHYLRAALLAGNFFFFFFFFVLVAVS